MSNLKVIDKSNNEIIAECITEDVWINGQSIKEMPKEVNITKLQNQKAIECLKDVKKWLDERYSFIECCMTKYAKGCLDTSRETIEFIDNKIKELERKVVEE
ncbi:MAG: hypothetical protein SPK94_07910 [Bacteroidales bacterium]|nr:hypothetical protein [Bacteroidales bacterium]